MGMCQTSHQIWSFYARPVDQFQLYNCVLRVLWITHKAQIFQWLTCIATYIVAAMSYCFLVEWKTWFMAHSCRNLCCKSLKNPSKITATVFMPWETNKKYYYSFKIFPRFWLAKGPRISHHNQLLMTKLGRILCLTRRWCQKCSVLAG